MSGRAVPAQARLPFRRVANFYVLTAISALAPLIALPAITSVGGASGFGAIVLGQSLGSATAMVVLMGWGLVGPHEVAGRSSRQDALRDLYWVSMLSRSFAAAALIPPLAVAAFLLAPAEPLTVAAQAITSSLVGLSSSWFFTGLGRSGLVALYETLPLAGGAVAASIALWMGMPLLGYPIVTGGLFLISIGMSARKLGGGAPRRGRGYRRAVKRSLRDQSQMVVGSLASYAYTGSSVPIVAAVAPQSLPVFAAVYRVYLLGRSLLFPFKNALQSWVSAESRPDQESRSRTAVVVTSGASVLAAVGMAVLLPLLDELIFSGSIRVDLRTAATMSISLIIIGTAMGLSAYCLIPRGLVAVVVRASVVGAVVGVPLLIALAKSYGAIGAALAVSLAEGAVLVYLAVGLTRRRAESPKGQTNVVGRLQEVAEVDRT